MKHPPITHGLHLVTDIPSDEWIAFFQHCKELAALARQRRAAKEQIQTDQEPPLCHEGEATA